MRTKLKLKGGISLIVLVITIIVMIILAAAIILSLSNSGIIEKANKAKTDSDTASLKEYANTLMAEWELMTSAEQTASGCSTPIEYANTILAQKRYNVKLLEDGTLVNIGEETYTASEVVEAGIKVGDVINGYEIAEKSYTTDGSENTASSDNKERDPQPQTITTNTKITWIYMGINKNGEMQIMADLGTSAVADNTKLTLGGEGGYRNGPKMVNTVCNELYSVKGVGTARTITYDEVQKLSEDLAYFTSNDYWLTTQTSDMCLDSESCGFIYYAGSNKCSKKALTDLDIGKFAYSYTLAIRPVVELNKETKFSKDITNENVWKISN